MECFSIPYGRLWSRRMRRLSKRERECGADAAAKRVNERPGEPLRVATAGTMPRRNVLNAVLFAALLGPCALRAMGATVDLTPGKYAFTITYEVQDQRQDESRTGTRCIAPSDLDNPEKIFNDRMLAGSKSEDSCAVKDLKSGDGTISYDADCQNRLVHVEGTVGSTEFSVIREVKPKASKGVSLKLTLRGKRTGDCEK